MSADSPEITARQTRVNEAIAAYLQAVDDGSPPEPADFLRRYADVADELSSFLANADHFRQWTEPFGKASNPKATAPGGQTDHPPTSECPKRLGDYEILEEIARGGMGVVYRARQIGLNRIVALKQILTGRWASPDDVRRFVAEAEAAAHLDHPGIVPIHEIAEHEGTCFFSMGYVDGRSLAERLRDGPLAARRAAMLLRSICEAVQFAHDRGVIHRDLKPANILLSQEDAQKLNTPWESGSDDELRPRVTDFGLAKRITEDASLTATGQIVGTPSYMSPEQAQGRSDAVGRASDIYSLGAMLYQMLTGRPPFQAETVHETLVQIVDSDPVRPRLLNRNAPRGLEAICMKCLEKDPARRYASARSLGEDLRRFLDGEPVHAEKHHPLDHIARTLRESRHEAHFRGWGLALASFAAVIFIAHGLIFLADRSWPDSWIAYLGPRTAMFVALCILLYRFRPHSILPTNSAERLVWVVWLGYLVALAAVNATQIAAGREQHASYGFFAILAGLGFLVMGGHVWTGGYPIGLLFLAAAPVLSAYPEQSSLMFGSLWGAGLAAFGWHFWHRERAVTESAAPGPNP